MIKTVPNEKRCAKTRITHTLHLPKCCPISTNPQKFSEIEISYDPKDTILEVAALREYIDSYVGGRGDVRSMEGMIQSICQDAANSVDTSVHCVARLVLLPTQMETVECSAHVRRDKTPLTP